MATCKECVHYELCKRIDYELEYHNKSIKEAEEELPIKCPFFKNKTYVVFVVRCKDCKHYNEVGCANGFGWCERFNYGQTDEQFCSYGERK